MMLVSAASRGDIERAEVLLSILCAWAKTRTEPDVPASVVGVADALRRIKTGGGAALAHNWRLQFGEIADRNDLANSPFA